MRNKEIYKNKFIEFSKKKFNNKFDYSKVEYENATTKVCIICPEHGEFWQTPNNHLKGYGCHLCKCSVGELKVRHWLTQAKFNFEQQYKIHIPNCGRKLEFVLIDFVVHINDQTYFIEYNGEQHYKFSTNWHKTQDKFIQQQTRDLKLREYCKNNNINLIEIRYDQDVNEVLDAYFKSFLENNKIEKK